MNQSNKKDLLSAGMDRLKLLHFRVHLRAISKMKSAVGEEGRGETATEPPSSWNHCHCEMEMDFAVESRN